MITPHLVGVCVLIEGGPGAAFESQQFSWNGNYVVPVKATGGAAGGLFNVPQTIFHRPPVVDESDWLLLGNGEAAAGDIAAALVRIIRTLTFDAEARRKGAESGSGVLQRSETLPRGPGPAPKTPPTSRKRTFSDGRRRPKVRIGTNSFS